MTLTRPGSLSACLRLVAAAAFALAVPLLKAAAACHNGMATFAEAGVSSKNA